MARKADPNNADRKAYQLMMSQTTWSNIKYIKSQTGLPVNTIIHNIVAEHAKKQAMELYENEQLITKPKSQTISLKLCESSM